MKLKRIVLPAFVGSFAIVSGFIAMPPKASSEQIEIEYVPLNGPAVEATNGWQWHPPMALPVEVQTVPVSQQVDSPSTSYLQRAADMPAVGPAGYED